jgi:hypothetical protein
MFLGAQMDGQSTGDGSAGAPPTYSNNGGYKPPIYNYGGGGSRGPATTTSSASSKRCMQPWLLLVLVSFSLKAFG